MLMNSWKGFFSTGSSFLGFVIGFSGVLISFFITTLVAGSPLFISVLITFSDSGPFIYSEFDLVVLSDISLFNSLFLSKFSSIKKNIYPIIN